MAHYLCKGNGLEVGALCYPYLFNEDCKLKYADIFENSKLRSILDDLPLDNLYDQQLINIEYILKSPKFLLDSVKSNTFDFVYSSHVLEHTPNPIAALNDQLRIVKSGGIVYVAMPNKKNTFDRTRKVTPADVLINKFENEIFNHTIDEALDVIKNTDSHALYEPHKEYPLDYAKEIIKKKRRNTPFSHF